MQVAKDALRVALRVLFALNDRREADPTDVEELRRYVPLLADAPVDELACEVIQQAMKRQADIRAKAAAR